eukprot:gene32347-41911_t
MIRKEDSEWLDSVLGIGADEIENKQPADNESVPENVKIDIEEEIKAKLELGNDSIPNTFSDVRVEDSFVREKDRFTDEIKTASNKTEEETFTQNDLAQSQNNALKNLGREKCVGREVRIPHYRGNDNNTQRLKRKPLGVKSDRRYEGKGSDEDSKEDEGDEVGSAVRWRRSAAPSQDERKEAIAAAVTRDVKRRFDSPVSSRPTTQEFKDLLLDESRMRVEIVGDWMTPYVKEETKWRYRMYKDWLRFLEDGFGDAFDVVEDAFEEEPGGVEPSPGSEDATGRSRNPSTIREKLVSRDDPSYSAAASLRSGDQGPPVSIPVLKSEVKKVRALLDNAAGTPAAGRKMVSAPTAPASRKGSRAALYDEYIRKIADAQQSSQFRRRKRKMNAPENSRSSIAEEQRSSSGRAPKTVLENEEESVDNLDEIDYINIRNPRRSR